MDNTILYTLDNSLYINLTNRCNCACIFCIRKEHDGVGDGENLWLHADPPLEEVLSQLEQAPLDDYDQIVFCGFGEPTERLEELLETARFIKSTTHTPLRLNTNGLSDLLWQRETAPLFEGLLDEISISLNAPDAERYIAVTRPRYGEGSFEAMLKFAQSCKQYVPKVQFSVLDILTPEEIERCRKLADTMGIPLRVRAKS